MSGMLIQEELMNLADLDKMSDQDALKLFNSIPNPPYSESINTDPNSLETIINDFGKMEISSGERAALRDDLNRARGYSPNASRA
jgi:hypothetical protein